MEQAAAIADDEPLRPGAMYDVGSDDDGVGRHRVSKVHVSKLAGCEVNPQGVVFAIIGLERLPSGERAARSRPGSRSAVPIVAAVGSR